MSRNLITWSSLHDVCTTTANKHNEMIEKQECFMFLVFSRLYFVKQYKGINIY